MLNLARIFGKKQKAMVFIDYEYCFYSYKKMCDIKPQPSRWMKRLEEEYRIADVMVFADFSPPEINLELGKLRNVTNTIIETGNTFLQHKKDMTDFIMLDYLYRSAEERTDINTYIIFTGDGHFQSVVKYLSKRKNKKVVVCGLRETMSRQLQAVADELIELPVEKELFFCYGQMIAANLKYIEKNKQIFPTFNGTSSAVAKHCHVPQKTVRNVLHEMIDCGYIRQEQKKIASNTYMTLIPDWDKLKAEGFLDE